MLSCQRQCKARARTAAGRAPKLAELPTALGLPEGPEDVNVKSSLRRKKAVTPLPLQLRGGSEEALIAIFNLLKSQIFVTSSFWSAWGLEERAA